MRLYPPGTRKGNAYYIARGYIGGTQYEINTETKNKRTAEQHWHTFVKQVQESEPETPATTARTFASVVNDFIKVRQPRKLDLTYLEKLKTSELGLMPIESIRSTDVQRVAQKLYGNNAVSTKNRQAIVPASSVLHFAAEAGYRDYLRVPKFKEPEAETRRPQDGTLDTLIEATQGRNRLLLMWLKHQGWRITETLQVKDNHIDLETGRVWVNVTKAGRWKRLYLAAPLVDELKQFTTLAVREDGRIFPWSHRGNVYRWLKPLCKTKGVRFTPHMARHDFGSRARVTGAGHRDLLDIGTWTNEKSVSRYMDADEDHARNLLDRMQTTGGKMRGEQSSD